MIGVARTGPANSSVSFPYPSYRLSPSMPRTGNRADRTGPYYSPHPNSLSGRSWFLTCQTCPPRFYDKKQSEISREIFRQFWNTRGITSENLENTIKSLSFVNKSENRGKLLFENLIIITLSNLSEKKLELSSGQLACYGFTYSSLLKMFLTGT